MNFGKNVEMVLILENREEIKFFSSVEGYAGI